jgi:hypothetical protein
MRDSFIGNFFLMRNKFSVLVLSKPIANENVDYAKGPTACFHSVIIWLRFLYFL